MPLFTSHGWFRKLYNVFKMMEVLHSMVIVATGDMSKIEYITISKELCMFVWIACKLNQKKSFFAVT